MGLDPFFNLVPQLGQLSEMVPNLLLATFVFTFANLILIGSTIAQCPINSDQLRVRDCGDGALWAAA